MKLCVLLLSLLLLSQTSHVQGYGCANSEEITFREKYEHAYRIAANLDGCNQKHHRCVGDMYLAENPLLSASGRRLGMMDSVCTAMPTGDRATCRWSLFIEHTDSELQISGVSYGSVENTTEVVVLGGTGGYAGVVGSGTSFVVSGARERWFELSLCYPDDGPGNGCHTNSLTFHETGTINDVLVPAVPGYFTIGAIDLFSNQVTVNENNLGITSGSDDGKCLYINNRWLCQWNTELPDQNGKLFYQGSIASHENVAATVPIIGGTGKFVNARGNATVTAKKSSSHNTYYWKTKVEFKSNCELFPKTQRVTFRQYVGKGKLIPSKASTGQTPPNPGDVRAFVDDLRTVPNGGSKPSRADPVDGSATGTCTELNFDDKHYCEWIMQYPLGGVPNAEGSSQIYVVGTITDDPDVVSTVGVVGGTGYWSGAHGYGSYQPVSRTINDEDEGSVIGEFMLEFSYGA